MIFFATTVPNSRAVWMCGGRDSLLSIQKERSLCQWRVTGGKPQRRIKKYLTKRNNGHFQNECNKVASIKLHLSQTGDTEG